ncbi:hypothetical protein Tco_0151964 [Tanacetum coccineum]
MSELVEDDEEDDEEIEESLDSNSESEDAEDEGPTIEDEDPAAGDEGLVAGDEVPGMGVESLGLGERVSALRQLILTTWIDPEDAPSIVPLPISSPMISLILPSPVASPVMAEAEGEISHALFERYDRDIGELFTRSGAVRDEIFSQRYRFRNGELGVVLHIAEERRTRLDLVEIVDSMRRGQEPRGDV